MSEEQRRQLQQQLWNCLLYTSPALAALNKYSDTLLLEIPSELLTARWLYPWLTSRNTSRIFLTFNLLLAMTLLVQQWTVINSRLLSLIETLK